MERPEQRTLLFGDYVRTWRRKTSGQWKGASYDRAVLKKSIAKDQYAAIESKNAAIGFNVCARGWFLNQNCPAPPRNLFSTLSTNIGRTPYEHDCVPKLPSVRKAA
jgi:hypothetical protein